jgi:hypothetical protein
MVAAMTGAKSPAESEQPALPAWKAFVVQFSRETEDFSRGCAGRVEHLSSGRRAHFESPGELLAILERLIHEMGPATV